MTADQFTLTKKEWADMEWTRSTDASVWAAEYMKRMGGKVPDEGDMIGWFANAMMAVYDRAPLKPDVDVESGEDPLVDALIDAILDEFGYPRDHTGYRLGLKRILARLRSEPSTTEREPVLRTIEGPLAGFLSRVRSIENDHQFDAAMLAKGFLAGFDSYDSPPPEQQTRATWLNEKMAEYRRDLEQQQTRAVRDTMAQAHQLAYAEGYKDGTAFGRLAARAEALAEVREECQLRACEQTHGEAGAALERFSSWLDRLATEGGGERMTDRTHPMAAHPTTHPMSDAEAQEYYRREEVDARTALSTDSKEEDDGCR